MFKKLNFIKKLKYAVLIFSYFTLYSFQIVAQQSDNGSLTGIVTDANGAIVPAANVEAVSLDTGLKRQATTNGEGRWTILALKPGIYEITVSAQGFGTGKQTTTVSASVTMPVEIILGFENISAEVIVQTGEDTVINSDTRGEIGSTISGERINNLPLPNRNFTVALQTNTTVAGDIADPLINGTGAGELSIAGSRPTSVALIYDGIDATSLVGTGSLSENISPAPEFLEEVKLLAGNYDASLGRTGGGNVQLVTRSGGQKWSGSLFAYAQNEAFNANDFFFNRDGIDRQKASRFEGGFTIGGPIIKEKLFFFGGYQRTDAVTAYVPSASSYVVLPEALAFMTTRTLEDTRQAFARAAGNPASFGFNRPNCVVNTPFQTIPAQVGIFCINTTSPFYRLLSTRNPVTGDFVIPSLRSGYERLFSNPANVFIIDPALRNNFPNGVPLIDIGVVGGVESENPLVRQRNVSPANFEQDQVTTRFDYTVFKGDQNGKNLNTLSATFFFANFPAIEPYSESTLASPFPLVKDDRNRTLAITNRHFFSNGLINEFRFGYFLLNNTRELDERLLQPEFTNSELGIPNPASAFVSGAESERCAHHIGRYNIQDFSVCAPNDVFNRRKQTTLTFADNITFNRGNHTFRFGAEYKRNAFDTNLPEEQGVEFEKFDNFNQGLLGFVPEADNALGITDKQFQFNDLSFYASDEWIVRNNLTVTLGLRWDWFGRPFEKNGRFTNFDPTLLTDPDDPRPGFILPANARETGFAGIDASLPNIRRSSNNHTLNGQDLNNFAPRVGFRFDPFKNGKTILSGAYGLFYDRPSASFINTVYSNYPFLREIEEQREARPFATPYNLLFRGQSTTRPFSDYLPYRIRLESVGGNGSPYFLFDNLQTSSVQGFAEPLEFRAVDPNLKTPLVQQWNLGVQQQIGKDWVVEARYIGTKGQNLLVAVGFNQPYDLNDPNTPDYIFKRINDAFRAAFPGIQLRDAPTERQRGCGIAFGNILSVPVIPGIPYPSGPQCADIAGPFDYNLDIVGGGGASFDVIDAELRVPFLGLDPTDAVRLESRGYSIYHGGQLNLTKRLSKGYTFNLSYTYSNSMDIGSSDPGSTTASGRPDTANLGLVVQGDQRDINSNRARSDFDRRHRFAGSLTWQLPFYESKNKFLGGWQLSGFGQWQSGTPFTIFATDAETFEIANESLVQQAIFLGLFSLGGRSVTGNNPSRFVYLPGRTAGLLYNAAFGRPNVIDLALLTQRNCNDFTRCYFNTNSRSFPIRIGNEVIQADPTAALAPTYGRFGNLGRNVLTGPSQRRVDLSFQKKTSFGERFELELKWDIFNIFNLVNFANPNSDLTDETDFGQITRTVGAPRVMQFGARFKF